MKRNLTCVYTSRVQVRARLAIGLAILTACGPASVPQAPSPSAAASTAPSASPRDTGRETLAANDGWASATTGTSGGAKADAARVKTVADRQQLVAALGDPTDAAAKIVYVKATTDGNVDEPNKPVRCDDYVPSGYTLDAYLKAFDPAVWGSTQRPSGALEEARVASQKKPAARVQVKVSANTTIVGVGGARLVGLNLVLDQVDNVIIRDLTFIDAYDCFPQWDPTDGSQGNWNSQYDNISLNGATHVWIDHNAFGDGEHPDAKQPTYLGRPYQSHDGALDIAKASDMVTVSWNRFADHDKVMLIGSSDTATADAGKLNVTIHHNGFSGVGQRTPRVRFGKVDVYDNLYEIPNAAGYTYSWGVGIEGKLYAENNVARLGAGVAPDRFIRAFGGKSIRATGTLGARAGTRSPAGRRSGGRPPLPPPGPRRRPRGGPSSSTARITCCSSGPTGSHVSSRARTASRSPSRAPRSACPRVSSCGMPRRRSAPTAASCRRQRRSGGSSCCGSRSAWWPRSRRGTSRSAWSRARSRRPSRPVARSSCARRRRRHSSRSSSSRSSPRPGSHRASRISSRPRTPRASRNEFWTIAASAR